VGVAVCEAGIDDAPANAIEVTAMVSISASEILSARLRFVVIDSISPLPGLARRHGTKKISRVEK
jgi:hypothetical protein